ncbi:MAG: bifunctional N(6)-L-threonylcarbamoyladenine synthase/serine/threonine protein kinase [Candidatus Woesearchaeota archaeon]|jgi:N6-L-threonylcarbamoyladenine synthase|nr:bifunctional N(6)-L-threonylcarbamoyladenine synthase/serine/threonine protein kinase [Candidatus Woesearchaeota archaeon]MDP7322815.1 bifunctional N(6)-L-threonylcarbamoyladenine synthase/serine/threonine protein kinase [Candidatus Woesearchaeota archaeon]MDP7476694.1 bifunctional N(6)-L-threonylcarbamoyladenine synthase/serine/threonine protein kinase [Candidatus Woesearchaeota archaeon]HJO01728.1 bifunctional N(6)-L-threonylcarbamoyladenine synthase/serine/threonine protein kinase [Candida
MKESICLGIESTAHTFGIGIITDRSKVLANVSDSFKTVKGGLIPHELGVHHDEVKDKVLKNALEKAKIKLNDINLVSFSQGPGIAPALIVGLRFAKYISKKINVPVVGVNHCVAHLEIGKLLTKSKDPVLLYASGANTQIIAYESGKYRIFGETLDQGIGNFIDSFARYIGMGFPGGPKIEKLALKGKNYVELPYVVKGMDVSFSGILTNLKVKYDSKKYRIEDLCHSLQETVFAMLVEVAERAMAHTGKKELLLGGGVACNKRLQEMCNIMCKERKAKLFVPENQFLVDNGVNIAWLGILMGKIAKRNHKGIDIKPYERTDDIKVMWK